MFPLPPARKEWQCGSKWVNGELTIDDEKGCGQLIYQSDKLKFKSGKAMVLNAETDLRRGGEKDMKHVCPNRLDSEFDHTNRNVNWNHYHWQRMNTMCPECAQKFNVYKNPLCPTCFKMACRDCGNVQTWIVLKEGVNEKCFQCGGEKLDVIQVFWAYERLYGKREF